jgi:hypothetical protein
LSFYPENGWNCDKYKPLLEKGYKFVEKGNKFVLMNRWIYRCNFTDFACLGDSCLFSQEMLKNPAQ